jgi:hypothetical protein
MIKEELRLEIEKELRGRLAALRRYLRSPGRDPHLSLQEIYRAKAGRPADLADTFISIFKQFRRRKSAAKEPVRPDEY